VTFHNNSFFWEVMVDGTNLANIVPDTEAQITYGRTDIEDAVTPTTCTLSLITIDSADYPAQLDGSYPEFTLGGIPSGFTDIYIDSYEGAVTRITLGTTVSIGASTPSGFKDEYVDEYGSGFNSSRFTGSVGAIAYTPNRVTLTCTSSVADLTRQSVALAGLGEVSEGTRAAQLLPTVTVIGADNYVMAATEADEKPANLYNTMQELARSTRAEFYTSREGVVTFRTSLEPTAQVTLPPDSTLIEPLTMTSELGEVINTITVEYGEKDSRETVTVINQTSVEQFGPREITISTQLAAASGVALKYANELLNLYSMPAWSMPTVSVDLGLSTDAEIAAVASMDLGDTVNVPQLLPSAPGTSYKAQALGYTEVISANNWTLNIALTNEKKEPTP
jgi:hypothetical protein